MQHTRRALLRSGGGLIGLLLAAGFLRPEDARAEDWNQAAFAARTLDELVKVLGGSGAQPSTEVAIVAPDIAENGAVVPIEVASRLARTQSIAVLVENNPNLLAAMFSLPEGTLPELTTRVKMAQTSNVFVLVRAEGRFHYAVKEIKVTLGGCGG